MHRLSCASCSCFVANVHDTRFGLAPTEALCPACTYPARARRAGTLKRTAVCAADDMRVIS